MSIQPVTASASRKATKSGALDPHKQTTSKSDIVLRALKRKFGVSTDELTKLTGWQAHSVRGFLSGTIRKQLGHEVMRQKDDILRSIPGIGEIATAAILIECPEIETLGKKQAASLAGLAPMTRQSGKWQGKAFIQGGRKFLRDALYMPALVAARFNPDLARKYKVFTDAGKPPQVALAAIMRKLIELANTLIMQDRKWTPKRA